MITKEKIQRYYDIENGTTNFKILFETVWVTISQEMGQEDFMKKYRLYNCF